MTYSLTPYRIGEVVTIQLSHKSRFTLPLAWQKMASAGKATMRAISQEDASRPPSQSNEFDERDRGAPQEATMTVVSVVEEGSQIAFASFDEAKNAIVLEHSHASGYDTEELVERFYAAVRPNMVLLSNKTASNVSLLYILTRPPPQGGASAEHMDGEHEAHQHFDANGIQQNSSIPYRLLRTGAFDVKRCRDTILTKLRVIDLLHSPLNQGHAGDRIDVPHGHFESSTYHSIASVVDFDSSLLVKALGSLLSFLQSTLFRLEEGNTVTVNSITQANSTMFMRISSSTLSALHIFSTEHHPLLAKGQGHSKEGFSLFSLLDRTKSKVGRQCLKDWMLKPLVNREAIQQRQDGVEMFLRSDFQASTGVLLTELEKVGAIDRIMLRMSKCQTTGMDFVVLARSLSSTLTICHTMEATFVPKLNALLQSARDDDVPSEVALRYERYLLFVHSIIQRCSTQSLRDVLLRISEIIDEEATLEEADSFVVVKLGFHEELDCAKEKFDALGIILSDAGKQVIAQYPGMRNISAVFLHQLGFLVSINKAQHSYDDATNTFPGMPQAFKCVFSNNNDAFFKNDLMRELDQTIGDVHGFIQDTERMIVSELEEDILDHECHLRATFNAIAELDCILCFTACASDLKFTRPTITDPRERCIVIKNGRHPLQEIIVDSEYVPNDTAIDSRNRVNIVTGPNFSGKSCYTRQVGVIVYMAHIGSFVPADHATIAITDQILARISTVETCAVPQSSFQLEMTQMGSILRKATPFSLVLVDEFGKGTSPASGIAVLTAVLKQLANLKCKVICTTHFLEVFTLNLLRDGVAAMKAFRMEVHLPTSDEGEVKPLFKIQPGVAKSSAGIECAEKAGVNKRVLDRAGEILGAMQNGTQVQPIEEICHPSLSLSADRNEALEIFLNVDDWGTASSETLRRLAHHIARM